MIETLSTAMGAYKITDVREGSALEPTRIVIDTRSGDAPTQRRSSDPA